MSTKELSTTDSIQTTRVDQPVTRQPLQALQGQDLDAQKIQAERRELARDFVTLKHTISQLRAERDRLAVENRDLQMRLSALETDYANLFSYVEGQQQAGA
jgi:ABC-type phosphate transport system auxiliary subunit